MKNTKSKENPTQSVTFKENVQISLKVDTCDLIRDIQQLKLETQNKNKEAQTKFFSYEWDQLYNIIQGI